MIKISYLRLLQGEEYPCSLLASIACKHRHTLALSLFLSCFVVHPFCLPAVLLGGQPRHWGVELGFCPVCVQKTPQSTFLSGDVGWKIRRLVSHPIFCPRLCGSSSGLSVASPLCAASCLPPLLALSALVGWARRRSPARPHKVWPFFCAYSFSSTIKSLYK